METTQLNQLKINVTNIKSILIAGKKQEKKISSKKTSLVKRERERVQKVEKESLLEKVSSPIKSVGGTIGRATSGFKMGIGGFLTNVLLGWLLNTLPSIIKKVKEIYEKVKPFIKGAFETLKSIFNGARFLYEKMTELNNAIQNSGAYKQAEKIFNLVSSGLGGLITQGQSIITELQKTLSQSQSNGSPTLPSGGASSMMSFTGGSKTSPGSNTLPGSAGFQNRNEGGQILNTTQPRQQDQREDKKVNGFRLFPVVTNKRTKNYKRNKENIDKFTNIFDRFKIFGSTGGSGGGLSSMFGLNGGSGGGLNIPDVTSSPVGSQKMYDYMRSKGMSDTHAKGLLANMIRESSLNPTIKGDNGNSVGLFQWNSDRATKMYKALGNNWTDWKKQIDYALIEPGEPGPQYLATQFSSPQEAADWWMRKWERPLHQGRDSLRHKSIINGFNLSTVTPTPASNGNLKVSFNKNNNTQYVLMPMIQREVVTQPVPVSDGSDSLLLNITKIEHDLNQELFALV